MTTEEELLSAQAERGTVLTLKAKQELKLADLKASYGKNSPRTIEAGRDYMQSCQRLAALAAKIHLLSVRRDNEKRALKQAHVPPEQDSSIPRQHIESLVALRSEYQAFAEDHTRVASMRRMASEFVGKLNVIIRAALKP